MKIWFPHSVYRDRACLKPIYEEMQSRGHDVYAVNMRTDEIDVHEMSHVIVAYNEPLSWLIKRGWKGISVHTDHGVGPLKRHAYREFHELLDTYDLMMYVGEIFQEKMFAVRPDYEKGLLGGFPKIDTLVKADHDFDREMLIEMIPNLDPDKPIVLFAPTWGGNHSKNLGVHNVKKFGEIDNLIICSHEGDYHFKDMYAQYRFIVPKEKSNINYYVSAADLVITDVSSVGVEAAAIGKPVFMINLPEQHPGCEAEQWKIPDTNKYLECGDIMNPEDVSDNVIRFAEDSEYKKVLYDKAKKSWDYIYKPDGYSTQRVCDMILHFFETGERKQF